MVKTSKQPLTDKKMQLMVSKGREGGRERGESGRTRGEVQGRGKGEGVGKSGILMLIRSERNWQKFHNNAKYFALSRGSTEQGREQGLKNTANGGC